MPIPEKMLELYLHLASAAQQSHHVAQRDTYLVMAAAVAQQSGMNAIAEDCRQRLLRFNPSHALAGYSTMRQALESNDFPVLTGELLRSYPFERAEFLLHRYVEEGYRGDPEVDQLLSRRQGVRQSGGRSTASVPAEDPRRRFDWTGIERTIVPLGPAGRASDDGVDLSSWPAPPRRLPSGLLLWALLFLAFGAGCAFMASVFFALSTG